MTASDPNHPVGNWVQNDYRFGIVTLLLRPASLHSILAALLFLTPSVFANDVEPLPATVAQAASRIIRDMPEGDKVMLVRMSERELRRFHLSWGMEIRNSFGLWGKNEALLNDCGDDIHPDECSHIIMKRVWSELFNTVDRKYWEKEQRTHDALFSVRVEPSNYRDKTAREIISQLRGDLSQSDVPGANEITLTNSCTEQEDIVPVQRLDIDWGSPYELIAWTASNMDCETNVVEATVLIAPYSVEGP